LANFLLWMSNQRLGSMVWDPQRQQALKMDGIIIIVIVGKVIIKKNKIGLVTPASGSPEVDQGLIKGLRI